MLALSANAGIGSTASGGTITFASNTTSVTVGTAAGAISASATGQNGGTIQITAGGNLNVSTGTNSANLTAAASAGNGGSLILRAGLAGSGNLTVSGPLDVSGTGSSTANGGQIVLISNSSTVFTVGSSTINSINGATTANAAASGQGNGGDIEIINSGTGGVSVLVLANISVTSNNGNGGNVNINDSYFVSGDTTAHAQGGSGPITLEAEFLVVPLVSKLPHFLDKQAP